MSKPEIVEVFPINFDSHVIPIQILKYLVQAGSEQFWRNRVPSLVDDSVLLAYFSIFGSEASFPSWSSEIPSPSLRGVPSPSKKSEVPSPSHCSVVSSQSQSSEVPSPSLSEVPSLSLS
ncbi:hypothetical protein Pmani_039964 [Petrolisthes manimaculis]|uniref:Uncharacterized protein n=1 Tax=Petrolisthes manimaculis TaxID=1843537 RepID=A0AAE1TIV1_9EUCA|nr:hypothetical protein Pmani_039964 [Petrolisthes manimaculis]